MKTFEITEKKRNKNALILKKAVHLYSVCFVAPKQRDKAHTERNNINQKEIWNLQVESLLFSRLAQAQLAQQATLG